VPRGQTNGSPVGDVLAAGGERATNDCCAESSVGRRSTSRYDRTRSVSSKLRVLAIFVIRVTQSASHVSPYCAISYIRRPAGRPRSPRETRQDSRATDLCRRRRHLTVQPLRQTDRQTDRHHPLVLYVQYATVPGIHIITHTPQLSVPSYL